MGRNHDLSLHTRYPAGSKALRTQAHLKHHEIHTQLVHFEGNEFDVTTATNVEEAKKLLATGFEYVTETGIMLFRRSKRLGV